MTLNIEQAIINHAKEQLSIPQNKIFISRTPISELPQNLDVYYLEVDGSYGNVYHHYIVSNDELFCSAEQDSLERLLKSERYLERKNLSADQLMILFRMLKVPMRDTLTIHSNDLITNVELKPFADEISEPFLQESKSGIEIVFWTTPLRNSSPEKWTVSISPDYSVNYQAEQVTAQT